MLVYSKESGYPITIRIETKKAKDESEGWKGYESIVRDENNEVLDKFTHSDLHHRALWVSGFFKGIEYSKKETKCCCVCGVDITDTGKQLFCEKHSKDI